MLCGERLRWGLLASPGGWALFAQVNEGVPACGPRADGGEEGGVSPEPPRRAPQPGTGGAGVWFLVSVSHAWALPGSRSLPHWPGCSLRAGPAESLTRRLWEGGDLPPPVWF